MEGIVSPRSANELALSVRERQVLDHLSKGLTNKEIAALLGLHVKTIKFYLSALFKKLNVTNRVQAMKTARDLEAGLGRTVAVGRAQRTPESGLIGARQRSLDRPRCSSLSFWRTKSFRHRSACL